MTDINPNKRPTIEQIKETAIFKNFPLIKSKGFSLLNNFPIKNFYKNTQNFTILDSKENTDISLKK